MPDGRTLTERQCGDAATGVSAATSPDKDTLIGAAVFRRHGRSAAISLCNPREAEDHTARSARNPRN